MIEGTDDPGDGAIIELQPLLRREDGRDNPKMVLLRDPNASVCVGVSNFPDTTPEGNGISPLSRQANGHGHDAEVGMELSTY